MADKREQEKTDIKEIANKIKQAGGNLYLVGGAVRDKYMNITPTDKDYCVTGLSKEKFSQIFPEAKIQGKDFPVFILSKQEFALARKERKSGIGHKAFEFLVNENITIEEDLARRDVTINSMAENVLTGELIDPFNSREDIKQKILRKTGKAFEEDPLRVYRVARFAATFNFTVEENTLQSMKNLKNELETLSKERVFTEFKKALSSDKPSVFFQTLREADVLDIHFQEIANLIEKVQPEKYHPEGDSYNHTMIVVDNSTKITHDLAIRFSTLVHDLGKGVTPEAVLPHHYGHDEKGIYLVQKLGGRIGVPNSWIKCGKTACKWHMKAGIFEKMTAKKKVELIENVSKTILGLDGLKIVVACDKAREGNNLERQLKEIQFATIGEKCLKEIDGKFIQKNKQNITGIEFANYLHEERVKWMKIH